MTNKFLLIYPAKNHVKRKITLLLLKNFEYSNNTCSKQSFAVKCKCNTTLLLHIIALESSARLLSDGRVAMRL